jgi:4-amino-4-deoxy-L-arabinose transferase-like glycosyltransferase
MDATGHSRTSHMTAHVPWWLLAAIFLLFAAWSFVVPINEAPDEPAHWQYARYLHDHWRLPHYAPGFEEANSPPLAYAIFAPLATDAASPDLVGGRGPDGAVVSLAEPRVFLNTGEDYRRYWPQRTARLVACVISVVTIVFVWRAGLAAAGPRVGLLAALIVALLPMFAFRAGHVSNDALLGCWAAAATWGMVRLLREPFSWRVACLTSAAVGLAYMSKISAIALLPPCALAIVLAEPAPTWQVRALRLTALAVAAVIVAPWTIRTIALYGDPFAGEAMRTAVAHIITDRSLFSSFFINEFPRELTKSFIGVFGWANVLLPPLAYRPYEALFAVGLGGAAVLTLRGRLDWRLSAVLALAGFAALAVVVRINLQFTQLQGRYLMPGIPAFAVLLALGLQALPAAVARVVSPGVLGSLLAAGNVAALLFVIWPAYHPAPTRTLPTGERVMVPTLLNGLAVVDPRESLFVVTGVTPEWMTRIEAKGPEFSAFEVELTATAAPREQRACIYYASTGRDMQRNPSLCADWLADGRPHTIRISLRGEPGWASEVSHLRLNPFAAGTGQPGVEVRTRNPRLVP